MPNLSVAELTDEIRSQIDEQNEQSITDNYLLQCLNRAQRAATRITARRVEDIFLNFAVVNTDTATIEADGSSSIDMPATVFGRRIEFMEFKSTSDILYRIKQISPKQRSPYVTSSRVTRPYYYDIIGTKMRIYPAPSGGQELVIHYTDAPDRLVTPQGQINTVSVANNYVLVDSLGSDLTTDITDRNSYVNIVDFNTGDVKATLQIASIDTDTKQVKFKSSGLTRTTVFNKDVVTEIPSTVSADDFICVAKGTCVSQLPGAYVDYLVQHSVVQAMRRIREPSQEEYAAMKDIEQDLKKMMMGRETTFRVRKTSVHYRRPVGSVLRQYFS